MNKARRKAIEEVWDRVNTLVEEVSIIKGEEEEALENLPDSFREGERGEAMTESIDQLQQAEDSLEEAASSLIASME